MKLEDLVGEWECVNGSQVQITKVMCGGQLIIGRIVSLTVDKVTINNLNLVSLWNSDANHYSDPNLNLAKRIRPTRKSSIG